jgi:predicted ATPase
MLKSLKLRNFKSFAEAQTDFGPLTLLVGANASGKSNVLDALRLLRSLALDDLPLDWALQGRPGARGAERAGIRGGIHEVMRSGAEAFAMESSWLVPSRETLVHSLECVMSPRPLIRKEMLREAGASSPLFEALALLPSPASGEAEPATRLTLFSNGQPHTIARLLPARWSVLERVREQSDFGSPPHEFSSQFLFALTDLQFLDVVPAAMRGYVPQEMQGLGENGEYLSAILFHYCKDPERKQELVDWLSELCAPDLVDIDFSTTDEGDVMLRLIEKDGSRVSARSLSDGTLRFLGELVALRSAPENSVVLMEELGNGLHPRRVHLLVEYLEAITEERNIQVIATTHSPLVLQALGPHSRQDVVVLGRLPDVPGTIMRRLGELPGFEEVVSRRGMDYLFTTGWLEQAL